MLIFFVIDVLLFFEIIDIFLISFLIFLLFDVMVLLYYLKW